MQRMSILESFVRTVFFLILVAISVMEINVFLNIPHSPKLILVKKRVSMIRKYHNHTMQTNQ